MRVIMTSFTSEALALVLGSRMRKVSVCAYSHRHIMADCPEIAKRL